MIRYTVVALLIALAFPAIADEKQRAEEVGDGQSEQDRQASSYLLAQALNADALKSFDVLIRYDSFHDIGPERYIRDEVMLRLRVDFTAGKLLSVQRLEHRQLEKEVSDEETHLVLLLGGSAIDEQTTETRFDGTVKHKATKGIPAAMVELDLVDVRYVGLSSYPRLASSRSTFAELIAASKVLQGFQIAPVSGDRVQLSRESPIGNSVSDRCYRVYTFDTTRLVPTVFFDEIRRDIDGKKVVYPQCRENIEWRDVDGVFVPTRIVGTEASTVLIAGKPVTYEVEKNVQFHWFSVNSKLDDESFSAKLIESYDVAFPLIDEDLFDTESVFQSKP